MENRTRSFDSLPDQVVQRFLSYLGPETLSIVVRVCRKWRQLGSDGALWKTFVKKSFNADELEYEEAVAARGWKPLYDWLARQCRFEGGRTGSALTLSNHRRSVKSGGHWGTSQAQYGLLPKGFHFFEIAVAPRQARSKIGVGLALKGINLDSDISMCGIAYFSNGTLNYGNGSKRVASLREFGENDVVRVEVDFDQNFVEFFLNNSPVGHEIPLNKEAIPSGQYYYPTVSVFNAEVTFVKRSWTSEEFPLA